VSADRRRRAEELFQNAVDLSATQRVAFLDEQCGTDSILRAKVEQLLRAHESETISVLRRPAQVAESSEKPGDRIGPYILLGRLGEGGMGVVYLAEQTEPVRRQVALKLIKLGMDTHQVIARFEAERQALAMMNHANVAKVFDAGATENGRPYFVMEYVPGAPITEYCDTQRLSIRQRLALFVAVCDAVQHAHQKGIIHRDVKPSNVLVTVEGDQPVPKVIDFGVAKATSQRLTERTLFTEQGQLVGTPEYMSPEQAEMTVQNVDTRTDIYSLGVLLYELLTGVLPFDPTTLRRAAFAEIQRIIREEEPPKPSTRLSGYDGESSATARNRRVDPSGLIRQLRGDLDWIVMKTLEKDRTRRYATASELAADVQRHLDDEPVLAAAPGMTYRIRKLVRRNRGAVAAVAAVFAVLVVSSLVSLRFAITASRARDDALAANVEATRRLGEAELTSSLLADLFASLYAAVAPDDWEPGIGEAVRLIDEMAEAAGLLAIDEAAEAERILIALRPKIESAAKITSEDFYYEYPVLRVLELLTRAQVELGKFKEAEETAVFVYDRYCREFTSEDPRAEMMMNVLVDLYEGLEKPDEVAAVLRHREVFRAASPQMTLAGVHLLEFAADGGLYAVDNRLGQIVQFDQNGKKMETELPRLWTPWARATISPDFERMTVIGRSHNVELFEFPSGRAIGVIQCGRTGRRDELETAGIRQVGGSGRTHAGDLFDRGSEGASFPAARLRGQGKPRLGQRHSRDRPGV
jgi:serine/threonine protein kinase